MVLGILTTYIIFTIWMRVADTLFGIASKKAKITLFVGGIAIAVFLSLIPSILHIRDIQLDRFVRGTIVGYALLAFNEEFLKFLGSYTSYIQEHLTKNDLILYAILIALGFAFGENIIYVLRGSGGVTQALNLSISRGFTGFLGHAIFSGTIAYTYVLLLGKTTPVSLGKIIGGGGLALLSGLILHLIYNLLLHYGLVGGYILYVIGGYFLLSYLFYHSDRVYLD